MNSDLQARLEAVEQAFGFDRSPRETVVYIGGSDVPDSMKAVDQPPENDPISSTESVLIPHHRPREYCGPVTVLDRADVVSLWQGMPDEVRELEREFRHDHDRPVPAILEEQ